MNTTQFMQKVVATGAKFTLENGTVGLTKPIPARLLTQARKHKAEIKKVLLKFQCRDLSPKLLTNRSKVWRIKIKTGSEINNINMIDPDRMSHEECKKVLIDKFGAGRVIEFKER